MESEYGLDPEVAAARVRMADTSAQMTARTPRGVAAVLSGWFAGGEKEFKQCQAELEIARGEYNRVTNAIKKNRESIASYNTVIKENADNQETVAKFTQLRNEEEEQLGHNTEMLDKKLRSFIKAQDAALPTLGQTFRNFATIIAGTTAL